MKSTAVQDSAGIQIVTSRRSLWKEGEAWRLTESPILRLGATDAGPAQQFSRIRGVGRLRDGTIVVADGATQEIRFFAADGMFLRSVGGSGGGPGEFRRLTDILIAAGDSVVAWDSRSRRISVFSLAGTMEREQRLDPVVTSSLELVGRFADGSLLMTTPASLSGADRAGLYRSARPFIRMSADGTLVDTLAVVPGYEYFVEIVSGVTSFEIPFGRNAFAAAAGTWMFVGANDRFEVQQRDTRGRLAKILRLPLADRPISTADAQALEAEIIDYLDPTPGRQSNIVRLFRDVPRPEVRPAFSGFVVDAEGNLWVADWISSFAPPQRAPRGWRVFRRDGRYLGAVSMPAGFRPHQIGSDFVVGLSRGPLEVERVDMYGVLK